MAEDAIAAAQTRVDGRRNQVEPVGTLPYTRAGKGTFDPCGMGRYFTQLQATPDGRWQVPHRAGTATDASTVDWLTASLA